MVRFESAELTKRAKESATSEAVDNEENTQQGDSNVENQGDSNTDKGNLESSFWILIFICSTYLKVTRAISRSAYDNAL